MRYFKVIPFLKFLKFIDCFLHSSLSTKVNFQDFILSSSTYRIYHWLKIVSYPFNQVIRLIIDWFFDTFIWMSSISFYWFLWDFPIIKSNLFLFKVIFLIKRLFFSFYPKAYYNSIFVSFKIYLKDYFHQLSSDLIRFFFIIFSLCIRHRFFSYS